MASRVISSIDSALKYMQGCQEVLAMYPDPYDLEPATIDNVMQKLRILKTFILCSKKLGDDDSKDTSLGSLLLRVEDVMDKFMAAETDEWDVLEDDIESFKLEIDQWYIILSDGDLQRSTSPALASQISDILDSILEILASQLSAYTNDYPSEAELHIALNDNIRFMNIFVRFAVTFCAEDMNCQDLLAQVESLAISTAHLTLHFYPRSVGDEMIPALLLKVNPISNPLLLEMYVQTLKSTKRSRELCVPFLDKHESSLTVLEDFTFCLLSGLWDMLLLNTSPKHQLQALCEGLRSLRILLKKHPNRFDGKVRDMTVSAMCDAGLIFLSLQHGDLLIDLRLQHFLENMKLIRTEVLGEQALGFPNTTMLAFLDFLIEYLTEVKSSNVGSGALSCVPKIQEDLDFLRSLSGKLRNHQGDLHQALRDLAVEVAYKIEFLIDQLVLGDIADPFFASFQSMTEDVKIIKAGFITCSTREIKVKEITWTPTNQVPSLSNTPADDDVVGFLAERTSLTNRLKRGPKKLQIVAIVGMPGLGKTTLATKVYNDPSVTRHFQVRAWCSVSQVFNKKKVLLDLLNHIQPDVSNSALDEDDLAQKVRRSLKQRRYLILLDDVWDIQAYECLKGLLPDDHTESRILITSRHCDVGTLDGEPHLLRELTRDESFELLERKLFPGKDWPKSLNELGVKIAEKCKGLPLTIVIVAGLLTTTEEVVWKEVLDSLRSGIMSSTDQCEKTIELSYEHLPDHLKPCFLSFSAFPEDQEMSVKKLIWQWIAEGFVRKNEAKSLEEVASDYLRNLIGRSLVMNAKERSQGSVRTCRIHDLLRDFCLRKASEENFLHVSKWYADHLSSDDPEALSSDDPELSSFYEPGNLRRLCVYSNPLHFKRSKPFFARLHSLSFFHPREWNKLHNMSFICHVFKLLRVLDMEEVDLTDIPREIGLLVMLRYLAIHAPMFVSPSIGNLHNLETLILNHRTGNAHLPGTFWNLLKLRHLHSSSNGSDSGIELPAVERSCNLLELKTISRLSCYSWDTMERELSKFPNVCRVKCELNVYERDPVNDSKVMDLSFLSYLESLSLSLNYVDKIDHSTEFEFIFPGNIKQLSLHGCRLRMTGISRLAELPNLEVLKLLERSFIEDTWHLEEGEFAKLRFLKLHRLDLVTWTASDDQFPNLERLVVSRCHQLEEIPDQCFQNIPALKMIEVMDSSDCLVDIIKQVEDYQKDMGNSALRVLVHSTH